MVRSLKSLSIHWETDTHSSERDISVPHHLHALTHTTTQNEITIILPQLTPYFLIEGATPSSLFLFSFFLLQPISLLYSWNILQISFSKPSFFLLFLFSFLSYNRCDVSLLRIALLSSSVGSWQLLSFLFVNFSFSLTVSLLFSFSSASHLSICFRFCLPGPSPILTKKWGMQCDSDLYRPCNHLRPFQVTSGPCFDSLINYPVLWFMRKAVCKSNRQQVVLKKL